MVNKTEDTPLAADPATERSERVVEEAERHHYRPRALTLCCLLRALMLFADMVNQLTCVAGWSGRKQGFAGQHRIIISAKELESEV